MKELYNFQIKVDDENYLVIEDIAENSASACLVRLKTGVNRIKAILRVLLHVLLYIIYLH